MRKLDAKLAARLGYEVEWIKQLINFVAPFESIGEPEWENIDGHFVADEPVFRIHECILQLNEDGDQILNNIPHYSTDGNDMLELINEMLERGWKIMTIYSYGEYTVWFENSQAGIKVSAEHKKLVTAVALAAYKALYGEEWTDGQ